MNNYTSFISINMNFYAKINQFYQFSMEKFQHRMNKFCIQTYQAKVMFIVVKMLNHRIIHGLRLFLPHLECFKKYFSRLGLGLGLGKTH